MRVEQQNWTKIAGWTEDARSRCEDAQLVLAFGATGPIADASIWTALRAKWPRAHIVGCSTAGEIAGTEVRDDSVVATALWFERSRAECVSVRLVDVDGSLAAGRALAARLDRHELRHVFVLSDGLKVNGSDLVRGLVSELPPDVAVTGGLAGDGSRFERTVVALDAPPDGERIVAIGLYGTGLRVGFGSLGGWDPFGPERLVTRSRGAVLYELDGQPALALYKTYLGEYAAQLPSSGLLFPLTVRQGNERGVVRTILAIHESEQSLTFAGDVPEGAYGRLMRANFDRLVEGASGAARTSNEGLGGTEPDVAFLVSCVGRKLVLQQRIEEEVEGVRSVLGQHPVLTGFYSYGEISPFARTERCELHNQTMTVTTLLEE
jgi:hypothetical protein